MNSKDMNSSIVDEISIDKVEIESQIVKVCIEDLETPKEAEDSAS